ncbi:MAG: phosphatase PAP2 family protein [Actinomycetota bacterium]|nr:phosphatase PAP2 family protein [Actinomycetota bacterium]
MKCINSKKEKFLLYTSFATFCLFFTLTIYIYLNPSNAFDIKASLLLQSQKWAGFLQVTNAIISAPEFRLIYIILLAVFILTHRYKMLIFPIAALSSELLTNLIKNIIARPRPLPSVVKVTDHAYGFSYISGHTLEYMLLFTFLGILSLNIPKIRTYKYVFSFVCFAFALIVGLGRVYVGVHWFTDIIGSYLLGISVFSILYCRLGDAV